MVTDIDAAGLVDGAAEGTLDVGDRASPYALGGKDMHRAPEGVGDDDVSVWGDGDAARRAHRLVVKLAEDCDRGCRQG